MQREKIEYYLINLPDQFDNLETYELFSEIDHNVLIDTADFYYFNTLLGKDLEDDFSTHSTDNSGLWCIGGGTNANWIIGTNNAGNPVDAD